MAGVKPQVLVHLLCKGCGRVFFADRRWWGVRLNAGKPPMRCSSCDPKLWRTDGLDKRKHSGST